MEIKNESVLVLDFGGQYCQLIARRVRDCKVYCEIKPYQTPIEKIKEAGYKGIIFTGGPNSVYEENSPKCPKEIFELGVPVLGICYGAQLMAHLLGGKVSSSEIKEYGKTETEFDTSSALFRGTKQNSTTWMSHTDYISQVPQGFRVTAHSKPALRPPWKTTARGFTRCNSTQRWSTRSAERNSCAISCTAPADAKGIGKCRPLHRTPFSS